MKISVCFIVSSNTDSP